MIFDTTIFWKGTNGKDWSEYYISKKSLNISFSAGFGESIDEEVRFMCLAQ